ncbi:hypothetical protein F1880_010004 [Penicillium rolfsii]|nr:hypothetical protein F1880_010004 [Penicillium rolfsii]
MDRRPRGMAIRFVFVDHVSSEDLAVVDSTNTICTLEGGCHFCCPLTAKVAADLPREELRKRLGDPELND